MSAMTIVNLTEHRVDIMAGDQVRASFPPSGVVARVIEDVAALPDILAEPCALPQARVAYGATSGLPEQVPGTLYVVSRVFAAAVPRPDLRFPGGEVRDEAGRILGCRYLGTFARPVPAADAEPGQRGRGPDA